MNKKIALLAAVPVTAFVLMGAQSCHGTLGGHFNVHVSPSATVTQTATVRATSTVTATPTPTSTATPSPSPEPTCFLDITGNINGTTFTVHVSGDKICGQPVTPLARCKHRTSDGQLEIKTVTGTQLLADGDTTVACPNGFRQWGYVIQGHYYRMGFSK